MDKDAIVAGLRPILAAGVALAAALGWHYAKDAEAWVTPAAEFGGALVVGGVAIWGAIHSKFTTQLGYSTSRIAYAQGAGVNVADVPDAIHDNAVTTVKTLNANGQGVPAPYPGAKG